MRKNKLKVLVVDDEKSVLFTYRLLLEQQGYEATAVLTAHEALEQLAGTDFDVLLCDLSLEENHTGFEVIEYARARDPRIGCILLTGYATAEAAQRAADIGVMVLYKPIEIEEFTSAIPAVLRQTHGEAEAGSREDHSQTAQS